MTEGSGVQAQPSQVNPQVKWPGFGYVPVRGLTDRLISRQLRAARKNMTRLFRERGLFDLVERMDRIRKSRQGMMAKNQMFQKVLDSYAQLVTPQPTPVTSASKAPDLESTGGTAVAVQDLNTTAESNGTRADAEGRVPIVEAPDAGLVIEE